MNREDLRRVLKESGVDPARYSLTGGMPNDAMCIEYVREGAWLVYYSERGSLFDKQMFRTEDEACSFLLSRFVEVGEVDLGRTEPAGVTDEETAEDLPEKGSSLSKTLLSPKHCSLQNTARIVAGSYSEVTLV